MVHLSVSPLAVVSVNTFLWHSWMYIECLTLILLYSGVGVPFQRHQAAIVVHGSLVKTMLGMLT